MQAKEIETAANYQQYVTETVDVIAEEYENDMVLSDMVFETVDSDRIVMMFNNNLTVLENSQNEPEEWKHFVDESDSWREVIQAMAFDVFRQDIWVEIRSRDIEQ